MFKTNLTRTIKSPEDAKQFLTDLVNNRESYHPDDDAHDIIWADDTVSDPTFDERSQLNNLMSEAHTQLQDVCVELNDIMFGPVI